MCVKQGVFGPPSCPRPRASPRTRARSAFPLQPGDATLFAMARCFPCLPVSLQSISQAPVSARELYLIIYFYLFTFYLFLMANLACFCSQKGDHPRCNHPVAGARLLAPHAAAPPGGHGGRGAVSPARVPRRHSARTVCPALGTTASKPLPGFSLLAVR